MKKIFKIKLKKLTLKNFSPDYINWINSNKVNKYLEIRYKKQTKNDIKKFISKCKKSRTTYLFGIFIIKTDLHIGNIKLEITNLQHRRAEVGIMIGYESEWGKGYGAQAIKLLEKFAKIRLKLKKLYAGCYESNTGSIKAFLNAGWEVEGFQKSFWKLSSKKRVGEFLLGKSI